MTFGVTELMYQLKKRHWWLPIILQAGALLGHSEKCVLFVAQEDFKDQTHAPTTRKAVTYQNKPNAVDSDLRFADLLSGPPHYVLFFCTSV